jgi:hypothetical protein
MTNRFVQVWEGLVQKTQVLVNDTENVVTCRVGFAVQKTLLAHGQGVVPVPRLAKLSQCHAEIGESIVVPLEHVGARTSTTTEQMERAVVVAVAHG